MICDWRGIKTGSRTRHRRPLPPPTIRYWLPASYGLCVRPVTYVRHAVMLDMSRKFERSREKTTAGLSRHEGWMYCSICTVCNGGTPFWMGRGDNGTQWKRSPAERQRLVKTQPRTPPPRSATDRPRLDRNETILLLDIVWCWRLQRWLANRWFYSSFDHPTWLIEGENFIAFWSCLWINRRGFEGRFF